ncbi:MAG: hypothetical protein ABIH35_03155 [Patescibacteria group bacterium]
MLVFPNKISFHTRQLAAVGYIPLVNLAVLWRHRHECFIAEHTLQGILLSLYFFLSYFLIPDFGAYLSLLFAALAVAGFIHASAGRKYRIPLISDFTEWLAKSFASPRSGQTKRAA